jgi:hypothetical protein
MGQPWPRPEPIVYNLPRKVRLRLRATHYVDATCCWLAAHKQPLAAELLWRACGLW